MIRSPAWCRLHRTARSNDCERDRNHSDRLWHTGRTSVLAGQAEPGTAVRLRARRHLSLNRLTGPPVLIHLVAPLGTHLLDVEVTACRQATRSACEHSNAQSGRRRRRGRCRGGDPRRTMALLRGARLRGSGARDPCGAPRNAGVQGGTESSNLLCSSSESSANLTFSP